MFKNFLDYSNIFFMYYIFIYAVIFFISTVYAIIYLHEFKAKKKYMNNITIKNQSNYIPVSILVPAYNEQETIVDCVNSIINLNYPEYEVIIIDDGSNDKTEKNLIEAFKLIKVKRPIRKLLNCKKETTIYEGKKKIKITLVTKENGGKADALNMGINLCKYPLFVSLDADSMLDKDSISNIVIPFMEDEKTVAVGGNIKISNQIALKCGKIDKVYTPKKFIVLFQMLEYYRVFLTTRIWFNTFNGNLIISGAFGMFKKNAVVNIGGYNSKSIGEDMDLVVKLHSFYRKNEKAYSIKYQPGAICYSQAPESLKDLRNQRKRWHMGLMQSLLSHKYIFLNPNYGLVGMFSFLYYLIYEMLSCVIEVFGICIITMSYFIGFINIEFFITFLSIYIGYSFIVSIASIILENYMFKGTLTKGAMIKLIIFSLIEGFGYRQICSIYRLTAIISYKKKQFKWEKITRKKAIREYQ